MLIVPHRDLKYIDRITTAGAIVLICSWKRIIWSLLSSCSLPSHSIYRASRFTDCEYDTERTGIVTDAERVYHAPGYTNDGNQSIPGPEAMRTTREEPKKPRWIRSLRHRSTSLSSWWNYIRSIFSRKFTGRTCCTTFSGIMISR